MSALAVAFVIVSVYAVLLILSVPMCMAASSAESITSPAWPEASMASGEYSSAA